MKSSPASADWIHRKWWRFFVLFCFYCKKEKQQNFPLRHPSASPRLCLPLSMAAAPVMTSCRCRTPAAWWTCKQHGHSYIFPSGRLGAVSTILFTLWIPRTRPRPAPLFLGSPFWRVRWCCVCLRVRGVALCCLACVYVVSHGAATAWTRDGAQTAKVWATKREAAGGNHRGGSAAKASGSVVKPWQKVYKEKQEVESISNLCYSLRCCC